MNDTSERQVGLETLLDRGSWGAQGAHDVRFSVAAIAVASGAKRLDGNQIELSVTLLMQPIRGVAGPLAKLPSTIAAWTAQGVKLLVGSGNADAPDAAKALSVPLQFGDLGADDQVEKLWQRLMAPTAVTGKSVDWWTEFGNRLPDSQPVAGAVADTIDPIVPVPRGDTAVSMALRRAKSVRERAAAILQTLQDENKKQGMWINIIRAADLNRGGEHLMIQSPYEVASLNTEAEQAWRDHRTPVQVANDALVNTRRAVRPPLREETAKAKDLAKRYAAPPKDDNERRQMLTRKQAKSGPQTACEAVEVGNVAFCNDANARHRALHFAATDHGRDLSDSSARDRLGRPPEWADAPPADAVDRRLHTLEGLPRLSRLFNLVVEAKATVKIDDLRASGAVQQPSGIFVSIAAQFADNGVNPSAPVWTRAKISVPASGAFLFWPCTQEEIDAARLDPACSEIYRPAISQRDGIVDLGVTDTAQDGSVDPRFDIVTVDAVAGVEAEINQEISNEETERRRRAKFTDAPPSEPSFVTLRSAGLGLVDRWRQEAAVKLASRSAQLRRDKLAGVVLDADALQVGWRLDVGVRPPSSGQTEWRSLCNRVVDLHDPERPFGSDGTPCGSWIEAKLEARDAGLSTFERLNKRVRLDSTYITTPVRRAAHKLSDETAKENIQHADDLVAHWEGDPLGIECNRNIVFVRPRDDLAIMQVHKPMAGEAGDEAGRFLPPPLRFGQKYRLAARVVYRGGVVRPLPEAADTYRSLLGGTTVLPADTGGQDGRALRRHERIGPVTITHPRTRIGMNLSSPYWIPQSLVAVIRQGDVSSGAADLNGIDFERRVLVAPSVGLSFATLHGVFDGLPPRDVITRDGQTRPRDGLANVAFATTPLGGFPVLARDGTVVDDIGTKDEQTGRINLTKPLRGDAIFDVVEDGGDALDRELPYYPDPAARFMVIKAIRTSGGPAFKGTPVRVPLYAKNATYPDCLPVVVDIRRASPPKLSDKDTRTQTDIVQFDEASGPGHLDEGESYLGTKQPRAPVQRVTVVLQPGDDVTLQIWCIPDLDRLLRWFDVVESGALLLTSGNAELASNTYACLRKISQETGCTTARPDDGKSPLACGAGGLRLPDAKVIRDCAGKLLQALQQDPVPEVASVQTLQAVFATSRPRVPPRFTQQVFDSSQSLTYVRRNLSKDQDRKAFVDAHPSLNTWKPSKDDKSTGLDEIGATDVMFGGLVKADLHTAGVVKLVGRFVSPETDKLDDDRRGFTDAQLQLHEEGKLNPPLSDNPSIFGFAVDRSGRVSFPDHPVTLMTLRDLAPKKSRTEDVLLDDVDLLADVRDGAKEETKPSVWRYTFKDTIARRVKLSLEAKSRFESEFKSTSADLILKTENWRSATEKRAPGDPDPGPFPGDPWKDPQPRLLQTRGSGELSKTDPRGAEAAIWLNSTKRPARIEPKSILPAFTWTPDGLERQAIVRIRIKRPWFSSGQDERLGIVVWPPELFSLSPGQIARYSIKYPVGSKSKAPAFSDEDLGPGGAFVTRWGTDPIRKGAAPDGWLVPTEVFADYGKPDVKFVENAIMPIPADDITASPEVQQAAAKTGNPPRTMTVSLLTYEPRFDPIQSLWFVDVALDALDLSDPFIRLGLVRYQEHAAPELRVSEPVTEWVQLLPYRAVHHKYESPKEGEVGIPVVVTVTGQETLRSALEASTTETPEDAALDRPFMRAEVSIRRRLSDGPHFEERTLTSTDGKEISAIGEGRRSRHGLAWTMRLLLPPDHDPQKSTAAQSYRIYVEEIVRMRSGSGLQPKGTLAEKVESGPRFAVSFELGPTRADQR